MENMSSVNVNCLPNFNINEIFYKNSHQDLWSVGYQDEKSILVTSLNPRSFNLITSVGHQEELENGKIRLDIKALEFLWQNQELIPYEWKKLSEEEVVYIFFDGTILLDPDGIPMVACISWNGNGWELWFDWIGAKRGVESFSAVHQS